jgi:hemerythrin-like metal-binding protein
MVVRSLQWTKDHTAFVPEIDAEHQSMFRLLQEMRQAVVAEKSQELGSRLDSFTVEVTRHFRHEENLMLATRYSAFAWHRQHHETGHTRLAALSACTRGDERSSMMHAFESVVAWLRDHTSVADWMFGAHLRNFRRERAVARA